MVDAKRFERRAIIAFNTVVHLSRDHDARAISGLLSRPAFAALIVGMAAFFPHYTFETAAFRQQFMNYRQFRSTGNGLLRLHADRSLFQAYALAKSGCHTVFSLALFLSRAFSKPQEDPPATSASNLVIPIPSFLWSTRFGWSQLAVKLRLSNRIARMRVFPAAFQDGEILRDRSHELKTVQGPISVGSR